MVRALSRRKIPVSQIAVTIRHALRQRRCNLILRGSFK